MVFWGCWLQRLGHDSAHMGDLGGHGLWKTGFISTAKKAAYQNQHSDVFEWAASGSHGKFQSSEL